VTSHRPFSADVGLVFLFVYSKIGRPAPFVVQVLLSAISVRTPSAGYLQLFMLLIMLHVC
jgi:hypothetical protein